MFDYSRTELATLDNQLEPLLGRAKERAAEAEQLAMDATRLLSVRPEQLAVTAKQPFYARLWRQLSGQPLASLSATQDQLFAMQKSAGAISRCSTSAT